MFQDDVTVSRLSVPVRVHPDTGEEQFFSARGLRAPRTGRRRHTSRSLILEGGHRIPLQIRAYGKNILENKIE